jgi:hypothetical protein
MEAQKILTVLLNKILSKILPNSIVGIIMDTKRLFLIHPQDDQTAKRQGQTLQPDTVIASNTPSAIEAAYALASGCNSSLTIKKVFPHLQRQCITLSDRMTIAEHIRAQSNLRARLPQTIDIKFDEMDLLAEMTLSPKRERLARAGNGYLYHFPEEFNWATIRGWAEVAVTFLHQFFEEISIGSIGTVLIDSRIARLAAWHLEQFPADPYYDETLESTNAYEFVCSQGILTFTEWVKTVPKTRTTRCKALSM